MTGIKDVAREVGLSTATVSRALRGLPRVSPETRAQVLEAATRMGYVASSHAASLASGQTHAIGVVVPSMSSSTIAMCSAARLKRSATLHECGCTIGPTYEGPKQIG